MSSSGKFVRASKYRHVHAVALKKEQGWADIRPFTTGESNFIAGNTKFFAFGTTGGGGPIQVHRLDQPCRFGPTHPHINVHTKNVTDFEFHPFIDTIIASGSEDCNVKVTVIPDDGLKENVTEPAVSLTGHDQKIIFVHFHPCANNILASAAGDKVVKIWDIEKQKEEISIKPFD
jgi:coronin-1B/1C/6